MGNSATKEPDEQNKSLDISCKLTHQQYLKHVSGEFIEGCLAALPWEIYYNTVSLYEKVNASFNFINEIPEELSLHVPHLRCLNLSHNQLTTLPASFHLLLHLRSLDLSHNRLRSVPDSITRLPQLHTLNLASNIITELPTNISRLQCLKKLNICDNRLRSLPGTLTEMPDLNVIVTRGNQLIHPPQAICDTGSQATLDYLRERHTPQLQPSMTRMGVFVRVRGQQVAASVNNPESASVEYRQAQNHGRTSKRKCPLMPPASASTLTSDQLTDMLLGLFYGMAIGDAMGLNTEGLSADECSFYYDSNTISLEDRVTDYLRVHYAPNDWSSGCDLMLVLLESVMRWGGVVDELEFGSAVRRWLTHGIDTLDPRPGHPLSPYMFRVVSSEGYASNPHSIAEAVYTQVKDERTRGIYNANPCDNTCLPTALVLGVPSFYVSNEVEMNAERICRSTHTDTTASAACVFLALLVSSFLQGKGSDGSDLYDLINDLKEKAEQRISDDTNRERFQAAFNTEDTSNISDSEPSHILLTLRLAVKALTSKDRDFKTHVTRVVMSGGEGACGSGSVVGGLLGMLCGYYNLPQDWLSQLPVNNAKLLNTKLNLLLDLFGLP